MKLRFTPQATQDLTDIADYIRSENPKAAERVRASVLESLQLIADFPENRQAPTNRSVRKHVSRRYGYLLYYRLDLEDDDIAVLAIRHPARERPFSGR
ncbi:MAG TPA: type II toxin-antitoxin system RelE/ParE family toxin [Rhizomicrobium sp.]|jgi:plasmid stabilization system protein ParE